MYLHLKLVLPEEGGDRGNWLREEAAALEEAVTAQVQVKMQVQVQVGVEVEVEDGETEMDLEVEGNNFIVLCVLQIGRVMRTMESDKEDSRRRGNFAAVGQVKEEEML